MTALLKIALFVFLLAVVSVPAIALHTPESLYCSLGIGLFLGIVIFWPQQHYDMNGGNGE